MSALPLKSAEDARALGIGYTLATGRMFCDFGEFHAFTEQLLGRPILTHEFAGARVWDEMRTEFEKQATARLDQVLGEDKP